MRVPVFVALALAGSGLLVTADTWVRVKVQQQGLAIVCTVPRHPDNRVVHIGISGVMLRTASSRQLDGEQAPITHRLERRYLEPCEGEEGLKAFCEVGRRVGADLKTQVATTNIPCQP